MAKICFVAGLTFWLGNATVLGLGIAFEPLAASAINQLPEWLNRAGAIVILIVLTLYVIWVWRRPRIVGRKGWSVTLPAGPFTLLQIAIGAVDLGFCALAMFTLMPQDPNIGFVILAMIFVSATLLGFASHAPGGIGVFDAAMLVGLWQFDKEDLLAGLLLFRLLYYIIPFAFSLSFQAAVNYLALRGASFEYNEAPAHQGRWHSGKTNSFPASAMSCARLILPVGRGNAGRSECGPLFNWQYT